MSANRIWHSIHGNEMKVRTESKRPYFWCVWSKLGYFAAGKWLCSLFWWLSYFILIGRQLLLLPRCNDPLIDQISFDVSFSDWISRAVVVYNRAVAQVAKWSLPTQEVNSSNLPNENFRLSIEQATDVQLFGIRKTGFFLKLGVVRNYWEEIKSTMCV